MRNANPITLFKKWYLEAEKAKIPAPETMVLATATRKGIPSARTVLLKDVSEQGFVFFTNYESRKGHELLENPRAALVFFWDKLQKQVRIEGKVELLSPQESDLYFATRARGSQISAWSSPQSKNISNRTVLKKLVQFFEKKFKKQPIPRPEFWGGFRIHPEKMEFWTGKEHRLHDRILYVKRAKIWKISRLAP